MTWPLHAHKNIFKILHTDFIFRKIIVRPEQLHADCRPKQGRWVYDRGALSLPAANHQVGGSWHSRPLGDLVGP